VAAGPLLLFGCATQTVEFPPGPPGTPEPARGQISTKVGRPGLIVAAPHGTSDVRTGDIAAEIARRTGFGLVVASGFSIEPGVRDAPARRYQVNRPSEGTPGRPPTEERATEAAQRVYAAYEARVRETAQGPLRFYAEIHGNNRAESAHRIEIATVGIDREFAQRLRALAELIRDAHLRAHRDAPRLQVAIEPADPVFYTATGAKRDGILRLTERGLHIELPKSARDDFREVYTSILADFVAQAVTLPRGR
jgi:hypothetical protein